jgi:hypothetical protein
MGGPTIVKLSPVILHIDTIGKEFLKQVGGQGNVNPINTTLSHENDVDNAFFLLKFVNEFA